MLTWIILAFCVISVYWWLTSIKNYWKKKNVPQTEPSSLLFGDFYDFITTKRAFGEIGDAIYQKFAGYAYVGIYKMRTPSLLICDPELLQKILVSNFQSFHDNELVVSEKKNQLLSKNAFFTTGDKWKTIRNQTLPCFSSGKMKSIFYIMQNVSKKMVDYIEEKSKTVEKDGIEAKELCRRFTTENVVNCSFGLEANCFKESNPPFLDLGKRIFNPSSMQAVIQGIFFMFPELSKIYEIKFLPESITDYFIKLTKDIITYRKANTVKRNDFFEILQEVKNKSSDFTDNDIAAHALGLFLDGTDTSSTAMSFILYELAANPQEQAILYQEIEELAATKELTYDSILSLPYLDGVMQEALRLHPPFMLNTKKVTEEFTFPPAKEGFDPITVKPGTSITIPYSSFHMDEKYFPNPTKFEPERFIGDRKNDISKCTFLAFGEGPRTCLGKRFAQTQLKVALFYIILNYELRVSHKMLLPLELDPKSFLNAPKGGIWINYYKRN